MAGYRSNALTNAPLCDVKNSPRNETNQQQQKLKYIIEHRSKLQDEIKVLTEKLKEKTQTEKKLLEENKALRRKRSKPQPVQHPMDFINETEDLKKTNEELRAKVSYLLQANENVESHNEELMRRISDFKRALLQNNKAIAQLNYYSQVNSELKRELEHLRYELQMERRNKQHISDV
ncbi:rho-associated protein kinase 1-like [Argopecten irradians]|uniref:rho-associated protein kinase 1-like n=1 Tax=Argopecten irradians TaxID=31199 RepID=UPI003722FAE1